ncbi:helix-turn-helix transcriptional regulator [Streptomyces sp. WMMB 322]|uniref:helix-turn-helix domain-containing protein n=1 Tax=Streptomyces sp. WMMB 322 TaxID=1286821 RepID=UPI000A660264|nr:helix-turn-helix transcriptional regulator [Streptomyces sp. WMMB 322]
MVEADLHGKECINVVGGFARRRPPRDLAGNPEAWPRADVADPAAAVIQHIARSLSGVIEERGLSLRRCAERSGVNRQAIADLIVGNCWPDVATLVRLEDSLGTPLYPPSGEMFRGQNRPFRPD